MATIEEVQIIASKVWNAVPAVYRGADSLALRQQAKLANDQLAQLINWLRQAQIDPAMSDRIVMRQTYLEAFRTRVQPATAGMGRQSVLGSKLHEAVHDLVMRPLLEGEIDIQDALEILKFVVGYASGLKPIEVEHES